MSRTATDHECGRAEETLTSFIKGDVVLLFRNAESIGSNQSSKSATQNSGNLKLTAATTSVVRSPDGAEA